jgi:hypothetical protein
LLLIRQAKACTQNSGFAQYTHLQTALGC